MVGGRAPARRRAQEVEDVQEDHHTQTQRLRIKLESMTVRFGAAEAGAASAAAAWRVCAGEAARAWATASVTASDWAARAAAAATTTTTTAPASSGAETTNVQQATA